jgi:hypothetical protein
MTTRRAVTYGGLFCLLAAWLASAASTTFQEYDPALAPERDVAQPPPDALANDVQAQAARLRQRLSAPPVPPAPQRNPFLFESRIAEPPRHLSRRVVEPAIVVEPAMAPEPALALIGVAEDKGPGGLTRTAIISDDTEAVFMVTVGQTILDRYRVEAIGADAVELKDSRTNAVRRLGLR